MTATADDVAVLLATAAKGDSVAQGTLFALLYEELRQLAGGKIRKERADHTLQPTALVNETFLRLYKNWPMDADRGIFFANASRVMRQILIDAARKHHSLKHGGGHTKISLEDTFVLGPKTAENALALEVALQRLERHDPRLAKIVDLKCFAGFSVADIAELLGLSVSAVNNDWKVARVWLYKELKGPLKDVVGGVAGT